MSKKSKERINKEITSKNIRVVGKDVETKVLPFWDAMKLADEMEVDLIEISVQDGISICKLEDYKKFLFEKKKKEKEQQKNVIKIKVKEIRLSPNTGDHDFTFKLKHAENFLKEKNKVKLVMQFTGREINHADIGQLLILKFVNELSEIGKPESMPQLEGKRMWVIISPK